MAEPKSCLQQNSELSAGAAFMYGVEDRLHLQTRTSPVAETKTDSVLDMAREQFSAKFLDLELCLTTFFGFFAPFDQRGFVGRIFGGFFLNIFFLVGEGGKCNGLISLPVSGVGPAFIKFFMFLFSLLFESIFQDDYYDTLVLVLDILSLRVPNSRAKDKKTSLTRDCEIRLAV